MTEDEAKEKWCPFVRVVIGPDNPAWQGLMLTNRGDIPADNTHTLCIGSACMAWRWRHKPAPEDPFAPSDGDGYCGLAGDPHGN